MAIPNGFVPGIANKVWPGAWVHAPQGLRLGFAYFNIQTNGRIIMARWICENA